MHLIPIMLAIMVVALLGHGKKEWLGILMYPVKFCLFIAGGLLLVTGAWLCVAMFEVMWTVL